MSLKTVIKDNAWNEISAENKALLKENGLATYMKVDMGFVKFAVSKGFHFSKDKLTQELINEYLNEKHLIKFCPKCGEKLSFDAIFCTNCGFKLNIPEVDSSNPEIIQNPKYLEKVSKLERKFNVDLTNNPWFECTLEELRESTFSNETRRDVNTAYVIIFNNYIEIVKESVIIKSDMGHRKVYFENVTSIDYDKRGAFHLSNSVMINTKSSERSIQLKYVKEQDYNLLLEYFENYIENKNTPISSNTISPADELMKYAQLYKDGLLTKEEFEEKKKELL